MLVEIESEMHVSATFLTPMAGLEVPTRNLPLSGRQTGPTTAAELAAETPSRVQGPSRVAGAHPDRHTPGPAFFEVAIFGPGLQSLKLQSLDQVCSL